MHQLGVAFDFHRRQRLEDERREGELALGVLCLQLVITQDILRLAHQTSREVDRRAHHPILAPVQGRTDLAGGEEGRKVTNEGQR